MKYIFRVVIGTVVIATFVNAIIFIGLGILRSVHGTSLILQNKFEDKPGLEIFESIDLFLIALVFIIMSLGFQKLFIPDFKWLNSVELPWLKIDNFFQLKSLLWNSILLTLLVVFALDSVKADGHWDWNLLVVPGGVFIFAFSSKFMQH